MSRVLNFELLFPVCILVIISFSTLLSLDMALLQSQLLFFFFGFLVFTVFSYVDYHVFENLALPIFLVSVALLVLLLVIGTETRGAVRWFAFGDLRLQISEVLKPFLIASFASFLTRMGNKISFPTFTGLLCVVGLVAMLIFVQPDFGNTIIYIITPVLMLFFRGIPLLWFGVVGVGLFTLSPLLWQMLREYQKQRILSFLYPNIDPLGSSYNLIQAVIAVGGGGILGRGLGYGTQSQLKFLPERHTDFIFATISENLGFIGAALVLGAFILLLFKMYRIVKETDSAFGAFFGAGAFGLILSHTFINIGGNVGLLPITGITLPLVSYGGSSLLSTLILLGILNSIAGSIRKSPNVLEIR